MTEHPKDVSPWQIFWRGVGLAVLAATLFTLWVPTEGSLSDWQAFWQLPAWQDAGAPPATDVPSQPVVPVRVGLVAGHWGNDAGAVCPDGTTEVEINLRVATLVQQILMEEGYQVDLFQEFDDRLQGYQAAALISIHSDSCEYRGDEATGFKIARAVNAYDSNLANRLLLCLRDRYGQVTGLKYHPNTITPDMSEYHAFGEVSTATPSVIIEIGFMNLDYTLLTQHADVVARGVAVGILCYVRNENIESFP